MRVRPVRPSTARIAILLCPRAIYAHLWKPQVYYSVGVLGAPPRGFQLAIFEISSIPCSFGLPSSFVSPNLSAFFLNQTSSACLGVLPFKPLFYTRPCHVRSVRGSVRDPKAGRIGRHRRRGCFRFSLPGRVQLASRSPSKPSRAS
jgi:hypothetical protein